MVENSRTDLKNSLFLGFCAVCILAAKMAFRWKLHIPGHAMFFTMFLLILARGTVRYRYAATFTAFLAGFMGILLGMGDSGPLQILKYIFPAFTIDLFAMFYPRFMYRFLPCIAFAAIASAAKFFGNAAVDLFAGMDPAVVLQHAAIQSFGAVLFGTAGSLLVPPVLNRLEAHGLTGTGQIQSSSKKNDARYPHQH